MLGRWRERRRRRREYAALLARGVERRRRWLGVVAREAEDAGAFARWCGRAYGAGHPTTVSAEGFARRLDHERRRATGDVERAEAMLRRCRVR